AGVVAAGDLPDPSGPRISRLEYRALGQRPTVEGPAIRRPFSLDEGPAHGTFPVSRRKGGLVVEAGRLLGLHEGDRVRLRAPDTPGADQRFDCESATPPSWSCGTRGSCSRSSPNASAFTRTRSPATRTPRAWSSWWPASTSPASSPRSRPTWTPGGTRAART